MHIGIDIKDDLIDQWGVVVLDLSNNPKTSGQFLNPPAFPGFRYREAKEPLDATFRVKISPEMNLFPPEQKE